MMEKEELVPDSLFLTFEVQVAIPIRGGVDDKTWLRVHTAINFRPVIFFDFGLVGLFHWSLADLLASFLNFFLARKG